MITNEAFSQVESYTVSDMYFKPLLEGEQTGLIKHDPQKKSREAHLSALMGSVAKNCTKVKVLFWTLSTVKVP